MIAIAIDGPAGSGKSTVADIVANRLGICHLDSGAMYRAVAYAALQQGLDIETENDAFRDFVENMKMEILFDQNGQKIWVNGRDVTPFLRDPAATAGSAQVAQIGFVRDKLVELQRFFAAHNNVVMDGRDIGTTVLPDAPYKFYITADVAERARRRFAQKPDMPLAEIEEDIKQRDLEDKTRQVSPLRMADDAVRIDSTHQTIEESVDAVLERLPHEFL